MCGKCNIKERCFIPRPRNNAIEIRQQIIKDRGLDEPSSSIDAKVKTKEDTNALIRHSLENISNEANQIFCANCKSFIVASKFHVHERICNLDFPLCLNIDDNIEKRKRKERKIRNYPSNVNKLSEDPNIIIGKVHNTPTISLMESFIRLNKPDII